MKIILNEDVYNLGEEGDVCDVARGYARNYLFPKNLAVPHTKENIAVFESRRAKIEKRKEEKRKAAQSLKERIEGMELEIPMNAGESGKLFGSVTSAMIVEELARDGIELEKKQVDVPSNSIKMTGTYKILVKLYESESAEITIKVTNQNRPEGSEEAAAEGSEETAAESAEETAEESAEETAAESATKTGDEETVAAEAADEADEVSAESGETGETAGTADEEASEETAEEEEKPVETD